MDENTQTTLSLTNKVILLILVLFLLAILKQVYDKRHQIINAFNSSPRIIKEEDDKLKTDDPVVEVISQHFNVQNVSVSKENNLIFLNAEATILAEPEFYHDMFDICLKLDNLNYLRHVIKIKTVQNNKENYRNVDCSQAIMKFKNTGSKSYGMWVISYQNADEIYLSNEMYDYMYSQEYEKAIEKAEELVAMHPSAPNLYDLGFMHMKRATRQLLFADGYDYHMQKTEEYFRKAIAKDPDFAPTKSSLAHVLAVKDHSFSLSEESEKLFQEAKELDSGWNFAWMNRALILSGQARYQEAYEEAKQAVITNPNFPDIGYVKDVFVCMSRASGIKETSDFYAKYGIDINADLRGMCQY